MYEHESLDPEREEVDTRRKAGIFVLSSQGREQERKNSAVIFSS
jgi:hypothetical protein